MKVHIESRIVIYTDDSTTPAHCIATASEVATITEKPTLDDISGVLTVVQHNSEQLYQAFVAESTKLPKVLANQQTRDIARQGLMDLISAIDASKIKMLECYATRDTEDIVWWCLKLAPVE